MSLTVGTGPLGPKPAGRFNFEVETPTGAALFWDPVPQRIRATFGGETVVDSTRAKLLHETKHLPVYYFPQDDLRGDLLEPSEKTSHCPHKGDATYWSLRVGARAAPDAVWAYPEPLAPASFLAGHAALYWHAVDEWFAEDEQLHGHPRDPYSRIDVLPSTRRVRVLVDGEVLADSMRTRILFETALPPRYYFLPEDVRLDLLEPSATLTRCAYKGAASHRHARVGGELHEDVAWTYAEPQHDAEPVRDRIAFYNERVDIEIDGDSSERPVTQWSR
jgi:uncharacterized protein (DUF427 family)